MTQSLPIAQNPGSGVCESCTHWLREYHPTPEGDALRVSNKARWGWCENDRVARNRGLVRGQSAGTGAGNVQTVDLATCKHFAT